MTTSTPTTDRVDYQTSPSQYRHWKLKFEGPVATLLADFDENGGLRPGYKLKLNSYDLGVDIELNDALNRIRFEHPEVQTVVQWASSWLKVAGSLTRPPGVAMMASG